MGTIVDGAAKAKKIEPKLPNCLIEGTEKCNHCPLSPVLGRMYSIEHRVYFPVPSITNHKAVRRQITKARTKQPSFHSLLNPLLPHLLQVNHVLLLPLFCSCGTRIGLVKHWDVGPHVSKPPGQRPLKIRNLPHHPCGKISSFLLILIL